MSPPASDEPWSTWRNHVLITLKGLDEKVDGLVVEVATLKVKAGVWGALGGAIPVVIAFVVWMIKTAPAVTQ